MALSRTLSTIHKHISSATTITTFRRQFRRINFSAADVKRISEVYSYHGFQTKGFLGPHLYYFTHTGFVFRIDVPGIRNADLRCTTTGSKFSFTAQEPKPHRFGFGYCEPRYYEAQIEVDPLVYQHDRFTAKINNGVLLVQIPKFLVGPDSPKTGWISLYMGNIKAHLDVDGNTSVSPNPN